MGVSTGVSNSVCADMAGNFIGRMTLGVKADNSTSSIGASSYGLTAGDAGRQDHALKINFSYRF